MKRQDFYYDLDESLIAQHPIYPRDHARLMIMDKSSGELTHKHFYDIVDYLKAGDVLVINNTRVIAARVYGYLDNGRRVEILLLKRLDYTRWECISRPARKIKTGVNIYISDKLSCSIESVGDNGIRIVKFNFIGVFEDILNDVGNMPLPPYITEKLEDKERYQTVYSKVDGSAAAPTAGLHFTQELLAKIKDMGVIITEVLLHVGLSTFRPVKADNIEEHSMHNEYYEVSQESMDIINKAKAENRRVIAVGTTSVRTLESVAVDNKTIAKGCGNTDIFIYPSYKFKIVDGIITNFHLPESTLIMLVAAFCGLDNTMNMYKIATLEKYRFFSFGDATLLI